jgi:subtilisin family serine protease
LKSKPFVLLISLSNEQTKQTKSKKNLTPLMIFGLIIFALLIVVTDADSTATQWVVQLNNQQDPHDFAAKNDVRYVGPVSFLPANEHFYIFKGQGRLIERTRVEGEFVEEQVLRSPVYTRIADPLYGDQWHLHAHPYSVDADHAGADVDGRGVTVAIVDDGLQHTHPELQTNVDLAGSYDYNDDDGDPQPTKSDQAHGTACAGVVAGARENGHCGRGVAPATRLVGVRTIAAPVTDLTEAAALSHDAISAVDVYSCSWGPYDDGRTMAAPGYLTQRALASNAGGLRGRLGKGSIYVWAAGNGRQNGDSCAFDGYASNPYVIAIGAIDHTGNQSWYSESCAALMAVMPSSGAMRGIVTADLMGHQGYTPGECTTHLVVRLQQHHWQQA